MPQPNLGAELAPLMRSVPSPNGTGCPAGPEHVGSHQGYGVDTRGQVARAERGAYKKPETSTEY